MKDALIFARLLKIKFMKIGINVSFLRKQGSGIGQVSWNFLRELIKQNPDHDLFLYLEEDVDLELPKNFKKRIFLPKFYKRDDLIRKVWWEKFLLPKKVKEDECDVFLSLYQSATVLKDVRHVMVVHDTVPKVFPQYLNNSRKKIYQYLIEKAVKQVDHALTISEYSKKEINKFYGIDKDKITVTLIDCDEVFKKEVDENKAKEVLEKYGLDSKKYIFYVGGFDVRKNVGALLQAYGRMVSRLPKKSQAPMLALGGTFHPHLVPLVTDIEKEAKEVCLGYGIESEKIKSLGFVDQVDLPIIYKNAEFFCYPSLHEGFGLPPLEAMNVGCAVMASNITSLPEVVGDAALLVNPNDTEEIAQRMEELLKGKELRGELVKKGKGQAKKFNWTKTTQKIMQVLSDSSNRVK